MFSHGISRSGAFLLCVKLQISHMSACRWEPRRVTLAPKYHSHLIYTLLFFFFLLLFLPPASLSVRSGAILLV